MIRLRGGCPSYKTNFRIDNKLEMLSNIIREQ